MKDNFSIQSGLYAQFRPQYPAALFDFIYRKLLHFESAWDCGTGNGQVAQILAGRFREVYATDISAKQLEQAPRLSNIRYALEPAEECSAPDAAFDLIVVAQAVHWFDFERFYAQVRRTLRPDGLLALTGYSLPRIDERVDALLDHFYHDITGPYWDAERRLVDEHYQTIPFPFAEVETPPFWIELEWTLAHFIGFLNTWSAVQHYIRQQGENPVEEFLGEFAGVWGEEELKTVRFPVFMRLGKL